MSRWLVAAVIFLPVTVAHAVQWNMQPGNSRLDFIASYEGMDAPGQFRKFDVKLDFDPAAPANGRLEVTVDLKHADMGSDDINNAIVEPEWFHVKQHPIAHFRSGKISKKSADSYVATGVLNLKGIEQTLDVPFTWNSRAETETATMQGKLVVRRTRFKIGTGEWSAGEVIGLDVKIWFDVELKKGK